MLKGGMSWIHAGGPTPVQVIREGGLLLLPAFTPHAPHRPGRHVGLVVEVKRQPGTDRVPRLVCEQCDAKLHEVTMHVGDIEKDLKAAIERFDASLELRTCRGAATSSRQAGPLDGGPEMAPQPPTFGAPRHSEALL